MAGIPPNRGRLPVPGEKGTELTSPFLGRRSPPPKRVHPGLNMAVESALAPPKPISRQASTTSLREEEPSASTAVLQHHSNQAERHGQPTSSNDVTVGMDMGDADGSTTPPAQVSTQTAEYRQVFIHTVRPSAAKTWLEKAKELIHPPDFAGNEIKTAKYSVLSFLPINLFQQFCRIANLYFLIVAILQLIPGLSPTSWFTTVAPLVIVLAINAIKEIVDDYHRHQSDAEINSRTVVVLEEGGKEVTVTWRDVQVGDIVRVQMGAEFPADLVFLSSSDRQNICYVETANMDGETNLKLKQCYTKTAGKRIGDDFISFASKYCIRCELPNPRLYTFDGAVIKSSDPDNVASQLPLTAENLLLRGCSLRKTDWILGMVVFSGNDSKIMMNRTRSPRKVTQLERHMNVLVSTMFVVLFVASCLMAMGEQLWGKSHYYASWYLGFNNKYPDFAPSFTGWILGVIRYVILLQGVIPISLYVTLEIVKVFQCKLLLDQDRLMYTKETDTPFSCRTTNLNEDLGQVQYVLSDKTGTLTQNVMGFVWASIGGTMYGKESCKDAGLPIPDHIYENTPHSMCLDYELIRRLGYDLTAMSSTGKSMRSSKSMRGHAAIISAANAAEPDPATERFFLNLAICNTVVPHISEEGHFTYQSSSPDEEALVTGAAYMGYRLLNRTTEHIEVEVLRDGSVLIFKILATLEFNSDRKRMSIICRCPDGTIKLFCKGADAMIMARLKAHDPLLPTVRAHLEEMAQAGYRTLCVAEKVLTNDAYDRWADQYSAAVVALVNRETKISAACERIEMDLEILGATAVEDKLQDGVPEAIESLLAAGIKVWVLTGDKVETAISISLACRLFTEEMALIELRERNFEGAADPEAQLAVLRQKLEEAEMEQDRINFEFGAEGGNRIGLVVEGQALSLLLNPLLQDTFVELCCRCKSVVCCRVSPMQKAQVVKLVQAKRQAMVLGIGDGANDVGMIQAAHIGCGISGREGRAAVMAADYSFAEFKYLARLLLFHGRAAYKRNTEVVWYAFYKNWIYNLVLAFFGFLTGFSAQPLFTSGLIATFNVIWTSCPTVAFAVLEQDLDQKTILANPILYRETMSATRRTFLKEQGIWLLQATWHSLVIFFVCMYTSITPNSNGIFDDWVAAGCEVYVAIIITVNIKLACRTRYFTWINHLLLYLSVLLWFPLVYGYSVVWQVGHVEGAADMSGVAQWMFSHGRFWLAGCILAPAMSILLDLAMMTFQRTFAPKPFQLFQELEWTGDIQNQAIKELGLTARPLHVSPSGTRTELAPHNRLPAPPARFGENIHVDLDGDPVMGKSGRVDVMPTLQEVPSLQEQGTIHPSPVARAAHHSRNASHVSETLSEHSSESVL